MTPRVLQLITGLEPGGAEAQVAGLSVELRRRGWEVSVGSLLPLAGLAEDLRAAGVPAFSLRMRPGSPDPRGLFRLASELRRIRPQILHAHMFHANALARITRLLCPAPALISTIHSAAEAARSEPGENTGARDFVYRVTDSLSNVVVAVSKAAAERHAAARAARRDKLRVIPNGVDTSAFRPDLERRERIRRALDLGPRFAWLAAGRLMWKKDHATLFRAFSKVQGAELLLAGAGPLEGELRTLAAQLGIRVRFLGRCADMPGLMNAADGLALSSLVEGLPMALLEAAASGLPAVTTNAGGSSEVVIHEATGLVVPPSDPDALGEAMQTVMRMTPEARARMAEAARVGSARFDIQTVVSRWEDLYRELLENAG